MDRVRALVLAAVVMNAVLVGAVLDQAVKQLPARHRIGATAFSQYSQAADLGNGIAWYVGLGVTASVLALAASVAVLRARPGRERPPMQLAAACTVGHILVTARAAPLNFSQRSVGDDAAALTRIFEEFEALNLLRATLQVIVLAALVAVLCLPRAAERGAG